MREAMIKGSAIREVIAWYERKFGIEGLREMARRVPPDLAPLVDPDEPIVHLLASSWYPVRLVHAMLDVIQEGHTEAEMERKAREAARDIVKNQVSSVYRSIFNKVASPEIYALMLPRMWRQLHDSGERALTIDRPGHAISRSANWRGHHPTLCILSMELMSALFEAMGCTNVKWRRVQCVGRADVRECIYDVSWEPKRG